MTLGLLDIGYSYRAEGTPVVRALERVSVEFASGAVTLVAGATGSGKSTLMRIAAGLSAPDDGAVEIDGERLGPDAARGTVGLVFQSPETQLFADTVLDDVTFGPRNLGLGQDAAADRARGALEDLDLDPEAVGARSPFTLSGGQARRVAIAGVLAMDPRYLLLDEPTAGLDASGRRALADIVESRRRDRGVVVVSHDLDEWLPRADAVVLLREGRVSFAGSADELLRRPETLVDVGLLPPTVLDVQMRARRVGADPGPYTLDPVAAAAALAGARRSS